MKNQPFHAAVIFLLLAGFLFVSVPAAHAAPGDFLFLWGAQQHFSDPSALTVDGNGNVYVTETGSVQVFSSSGVRIRKWGSYGSGDGQFSYPTGIAVDRNGKVYVLDTGNNRVQVFDSAGNFLDKWSNNWWGNALHSIAVDGSGNVYVSDTGNFDPETGGYENGSVQVFDSEGTFLRYLGSQGSGNGEFSAPMGLAVDASGNVYVGDYMNSRVQIFSPTGAFIKTAVESVYINNGLAVDPNGNIYVCTSAGGYPFGAVALFDSAGNLVREMHFGDDYYTEHYWEPFAVAADRLGNVYLLDASNDGVRAFDTAGNPLSQWWTYGTGDAQLTSPVGIAIDSGGNVYETNGHDEVAKVFNRKIRVFDSEGKFLRKWSGDFYVTSGIAVDQQDRVYVLEPFSYYWLDPSSTVNVFDRNGSLLRRWGAYGSDNGQLTDPFGIAVEKNGNVVVADTGNSRVEIFDSSGNFLRHLGTEGSGNGQFSRPQGVAVDAEGNIFVADSGNSRVQVFSSSYNFVRKWGAPGSSDALFSEPSGIAVDVNGNVLVADSGNNRIEVFDRFGNFLLKWGMEGDENSQFRTPRGIAVNKAGTRVYVADTGNNRIQVFEGYGAAQKFYVGGTVRRGSKTGPVLAGATVTIAGKTATTGGSGTFKITGIPAGAYTLTISKSGYTTRKITGFVVNGNKNLVTYLKPAPRYYLSGIVRQGTSTGPALAGATVSVAGKSTTTASNGTFTITGILAGAYTITISKSGYVTRTITGFVVNGNKSIASYLKPDPGAQKR